MHLQFGSPKKQEKALLHVLNPECVQKIAEIKLKQKDFHPYDSFLGYNMNYVNYNFKLLNDRLGLGNSGRFSRLRPHILRKFHSTHLNQGSPYQKLGMDEIDCLHGCGKNKTMDSYFKDNPEYLKYEYVKVMDNVSLYHKYNYKIIDGEIRILVKPLL